MRTSCIISLLWCVLANCVCAVEDAPPQSKTAYDHQINTPCWQWEDLTAEGKLRVLFIVNSKATGEPLELSRRFNITPIIIGVTSGGLSLDVLKDALEKKPDVIVVATFNTIAHLKNEDTKSLLRQVVWDGVPLVIFGPHWLKKGKAAGVSSWIGGETEQEITTDLLQNYPISILPLKQQLKVYLRKVGKGRVVATEGYENHWTGFGAFAQSSIKHSLESYPIVELSYAVANQIIHAAIMPIAQNKAPTIPDQIMWPNPILLTKNGVSNIRWEIHTKYGESIAKGSTTDTETSLLVSQAGSVWFRWAGPEHTYGLSKITIHPPVHITAPAVSAELQGPCMISWSSEGSSLPTDEIEWQIYAPGKRLINSQRFLVSSGKGELEALVPGYTTYLARGLLLRQGHILDEQRLYFNRPIDRTNDKGVYHVVGWATERGSESDRKRMIFLRELGITALATGGQGAATSTLAAQEGFRVVPTNVYAPQHVKKLLAQAGANAEQNRIDYEVGAKNLAKQIHPYSPLGYHLSDEPHGVDIQSWRSQGEKLIHSEDSDARVGYSGVWARGDIASALREMDYLTGYSPGYLYTPNLWLGVERDVFRNFRSSGGIRTCWTHYAPRLDCEPYSRTAPWLWLFEEMDGISYFDTGGDFAILPGDLSLTHESRWWREEVQQLQTGTARQILRAQRERGCVRIVYSPDADEFAYGFSEWVRVLNEQSVPYAIIDRCDLAKGIDKDAKLIILPSVEELDDAGLNSLRSAAENGCVVVATAPLGVFKKKEELSNQGGQEAGDNGVPVAVSAGPTDQNCELVQAQRLESLFGVHRTLSNEGVSTWLKSRNLMRGVNVKAVWAEQSEKIFEPLEGKFCGEANYRASDGTVIAEISQVGEEFTESNENEPDYIKSVRETPAVISKRHGSGFAYYFAFMPQIQDLRILLPRLLTMSRVPETDFKIIHQKDAESKTYLYPFKDGQKHLVGIVGDYWQVSPSWVLDARTQKNTKGYYTHGPSWWKPREEIIQVPTGLYVYDSRQGKLLGKEQNLKLQIQPGRPELLACLPYQVTSVSISSPDKGELGAIHPVIARINTIPELSAKDHYVSFMLIAPGEEMRIENTKIVLATNGEVTAQLQLPINAASGRWILRAKDVVSGMQTEQIIQFSARADVTTPLQEERGLYAKIPAYLPEGQWARWQDEATIFPPSGVRVKVEPLSRSMGVNHKGERSYYMLRGGFSLANTSAAYGVRYNVGNDWGREKVTDKRQIIAAYPPGLGFTSPNPTGWWVNRYIQFSLNGSNDINKYAVRSIQEIPRNNGGEVSVTWEAPQGEIDLSFVMLPDHQGVFQRITIRSEELLEQVKTTFTTFAGGYAAKDRRLILSEDRQTWQLVVDAQLDRLYGKGGGPTGLMIIPEEWDTIRFHTNAPTFGKSSFSPGQKQVQFHWLLWSFSDLTNSAAEQYMKKNADKSMSTLLQVFNIQTR